MKTYNIIFKQLGRLYFILMLSLGVASCVEEDGADVLFTGDTYQNIMQYINANEQYSSFKLIIETAEMTDALSSYNSNGGTFYTLFLPTNSGVDKYISDSERYSTLEELLQDKAYAAEIIRYHLLNGSTPSKDFANGALINKTISSYTLTTNFREENEVVTFSVNDVSKVLLTDIELSNGIIHTIDKMLEPVVFTSYEWLEESNDFTIFFELLTKCGMADTLNAFEVDEIGRLIYNEYTVFAESDLLYATNGIQSFEDLVNLIDPLGTSGQDYLNTSNAVNKYARYHILDRSVFLDEFSSGIYNTYGDFPVSVNLDDSLKINTGTSVFDTIIVGNDSIKVNFLQVKTEQSNIVTRSGAIHQLDRILLPYLPGRQIVTIHFYEEPIIDALRGIESSFTLQDDELEFTSLIGTRTMSYVNSPTTIRNCFNDDYIEFSGDIDFSYTTPKILAGRYRIKLIIHRGFSSNASIQSFVDNKRVGTVVDATETIGNQAIGFNNNNNDCVIGTVEFTEYSSHTIKFSTVIPGRMQIDRIIFEPI